MNKEMIFDVLLDALKDSLIVFAIILVFNFILSLFEVKMAKKLNKESKFSPLFGSLFGLIPQCGVSVIASDLYIKEHITTGTLVAIFLSCSDEAIPLMIAEHSEKSLYAFLFLGLKFAIGFIFGFIIDLIVREKHHIEEHLDHCDHHEEVHSGCCHHSIDDEEESKLHKYLVHPLVHSLKLFLYVLIINLIFGFIIAFVGENVIVTFLVNNKYLSPLFSTIIGIIPNCASSVIITELFMSGGLTIGATLGGLLMNAGLGILYLFKKKENIKKNLLILLTLFIISVSVAYITSLIIGF